MINISIKKKKKIINYLLNSLFKSKNFYGESLNKTSKNILPFIYGTRHNYSIIDLKNTSLFIKRSFKIIQHTIKKNKKILIIGNSNEVNFLINKNLTKNNKNILYFNKEWTNGLITNNDINNKFKNQKIDLILIIKNSINDNFLHTELSSLRIPMISFLNTSQNLNKIDYPIIMNSNNMKSLYILLYLIRKIF